MAKKSGKNVEAAAEAPELQRKEGFFVNNIPSKNIKDVKSSSVPLKRITVFLPKDEEIRSKIIPEGTPNAGNFDRMSFVVGENRLNFHEFDNGKISGEKSNSANLRLCDAGSESEKAMNVRLYEKGKPMDSYVEAEVYPADIKAAHDKNRKEYKMSMAAKSKEEPSAAQTTVEAPAPEPAVDDDCPVY